MKNLGYYNGKYDELEKMQIPVDKIAEKVVPRLEEISNEKLEYDNAKDGILVLLMFLMISEKMQNGPV